MSLIVVVALLAVGLMEHSSAFKLTTPQRDAGSLPGFSFVDKTFGAVSMKASKGALHGYDAIRNTTAWHLYLTPDSKAIRQNVTLSTLKVLYDDTKARFGIRKVTKKVVANLTSSAFQLTLNATGTAEHCRLQVQVQATDLQVDMDLKELGFVGFIFQAYRTVMKALTATVSKSLKQLPAQLATSVEGVLAGKMDLNDLCLKLLASTPANFPEPNLD